MTEAAQLETDVLILGAGPVGLTLHLALAARGIRSHLIERRPMSALQADPRVLALSHGARQLLEQIDSWPARAATAIENIHISQRGGFGRTVLDKAEYGLLALGYVVRYREVVAALARHLSAGALFAEAEGVATQVTPQGVQLTLRQGEERQL